MLQFLWSLEGFSDQLRGNMRLQKFIFFLSLNFRQNQWIWKEFYPDEELRGLSAMEMESVEIKSMQQKVKLTKLKTQNLF